jgi:hypothetical protein
VVPEEAPEPVLPVVAEEPMELVREAELAAEPEEVEELLALAAVAVVEVELELELTPADGVDPTELDAEDPLVDALEAREALAVVEVERPTVDDDPAAAAPAVVPDVDDPPGGEEQAAARTATARQSWIFLSTRTSSRVSARAYGEGGRVPSKRSHTRV